MYRCLQLAAIGAGSVAPNPMVGSVLVHNNLIIGEGYHQAYGKEHAEVNCINSVKSEHVHLIRSSVLYVSLEPCAHFGKTPPCTDLIIRTGIPEVVIGCTDPNPAVAGNGIALLEKAGIRVHTNLLERQSEILNKRFFTNILEQRPYIILKWAQSADLRLSGSDSVPVKISSGITDRLVHQWRSEEAAIMVGTNTALNDNPLLTNRWWTGKSPVRIIVDRTLRLPMSLHIFNRQNPTIVFNELKNEEHLNLQYIQTDENESLLPQILKALIKTGIQSVLVEGGRSLLQSFIDAGYWDEARVITNRKLRIGAGVNSPELRNETLQNEYLLGNDEVQIFHQSSNI